MITQEQIFYCKSCQKNLIRLVPYFNNKTPMIYFNDNTYFQTQSDQNSTEFKLIFVYCKMCQIIVANLKWEFYNDFIEEAKNVLSENVFIIKENLYRRVFWDQSTSDFNETLNSTFNIFGRFDRLVLI